MKYISGIAALNLGKRDETPGDWHFSSVDWKYPLVLDTDISPFAHLGIYFTQVPLHGRFPVASHVRACLDLIEQGYFNAAQGMRDTFISNEAFTPLIMREVWKLRNRSDWDSISKFMGREYLLTWVDFVKSQERSEAVVAS